MSERKYNRRAAVGLGCCQFFLGFFMMILGGQIMFYQLSYSYYFYGMWGGLVTLISGIFTISTGNCGHERDGFIYFNLFFSLLNILSNMGVIALSSLSLIGFVPEDQVYKCRRYGSSSDRCYDMWSSSSYRSFSFCSVLLDGAQCVSQDITGVFLSSALWTTGVLIALAGISISLAIPIACLACSCCRKSRRNRVQPEIQKTY